MKEIINNNQKWIFLNFKNNKIKYETDEEKIKLFSELRIIDKLIKNFKCKEIISKYNNNIFEIYTEVINNKELRIKLYEFNNKIKIEEEKKEKIYISEKDSALNIIKKQLGLWNE